MNKVDVLFCGWGQRWQLGTLADNGRAVIFEYTGDALRRGIQFSQLNLPLQPGAFGDFPSYLDHLPGLVYDSLPDGWGLLLMDRLFLKNGRPLSSISPLDRLSFIGERAMGALAFLPSSPMPLTTGDLDLMQLATAVKDVISDRDTAALKQLALVGGSPHGARPKALVQYDAQHQTIHTREDAPGTPWLVKFPGQGDHKEVCAIEQIYSEMGARCGLVVPRTQVFDLGRNLAAFGIERFDRERGMRVPVQSFAAALHADFRTPSMDYRMVLRATMFFTNDVTQVEAAFRQCVFNVVFNNRDDHSKNFSFRMNQAMAWKVSPSYDLTFNGGPNGYHQTSVMGEALSPGRGHLLALAADSSLRKDVAEGIIERALDVSTCLAQELRQYSFIRQDTIRLITSTVNANAARCAHIAAAPGAKKTGSPRRPS